MKTLWPKENRCVEFRSYENSQLSEFSQGLRNFATLANLFIYFFRRQIFFNIYFSRKDFFLKYIYKKRFFFVYYYYYFYYIAPAIVMLILDFPYTATVIL